MTFIRPKTWQWIDWPDADGIPRFRLLYTWEGLAVVARMQPVYRNFNPFGWEYAAEIAYFDLSVSAFQRRRVTYSRGTTRDMVQAAAEAWLDSTLPECVAAMGGGVMLLTWLFRGREVTRREPYVWGQRIDYREIIALFPKYGRKMVPCVIDDPVFVKSDPIIFRYEFVTDEDECV